MLIQKLRRREGGFTLIELLIVIAIIGIIAALIIPNLLDALQKSKQKKTMADERTFGVAIFSAVSDIAVQGAAGQTAQIWDTAALDLVSFGAVQSFLAPSSTFFYLQDVPEFDGWGAPYQYYFVTDWDTTPNLLYSRTNAFGVVSCGRTDDPSACQADCTYTVGAFVGTDYSQDIVWANGSFMRSPVGRVDTN